VDLTLSGSACTARIFSKFDLNALIYLGTKSPLPVRRLTCFRFACEQPYVLEPPALSYPKATPARDMSTIFDIQVVPKIILPRQKSDFRLRFSPQSVKVFGNSQLGHRFRLAPRAHARNLLVLWAGPPRPWTGFSPDFRKTAIFRDFPEKCRFLTFLAPRRRGSKNVKNRHFSRKSRKKPDFPKTGRKTCMAGLEKNAFFKLNLERVFFRKKGTFGRPHF